MAATTASMSRKFFVRNGVKMTVSQLAVVAADLAVNTVMEAAQSYGINPAEQAWELPVEMVRQLPVLRDSPELSVVPPHLITEHPAYPQYLCANLPISPWGAAPGCVHCLDAPRLTGPLCRWHSFFRLTGKSLGGIQLIAFEELDKRNIILDQGLEALEFEQGVTLRLLMLTSLIIGSEEDDGHVYKPEWGVVGDRQPTRPQDDDEHQVGGGGDNDGDDDDDDDDHDEKPGETSGIDCCSTCL